MNATVVQLTLRSVVGRRRALVLFALPALLLAMAVFGRAVAGADPDLISVIAEVLGLGTMMPLVGLIAGTGVIAPEIEDRSIMYVLAKPVSRASIFLSKLVVAIGLMVVMGVLPIVGACVIVTGTFDEVAIAYGLGALAAGIAYAALFCMLPVITRNAVFVGLGYALVWETLVGQLVPGAMALSVQQWSLAIVEHLGDETAPVSIDSAVELRTAVICLVVLVIAASWYGIRRLGTLRIASGVD